MLLDEKGQLQVGGVGEQQQVGPAGGRVRRCAGV